MTFDVASQRIIIMISYERRKKNQQHSMGSQASHSCGTTEEKKEKKIAQQNQEQIIYLCMYIWHVLHFASDLYGLSITSHTQSDQLLAKPATSEMKKTKLYERNRGKRHRLCAWHFEEK